MSNIIAFPTPTQRLAASERQRRSTGINSTIDDDSQRGPAVILQFGPRTSPRERNEVARPRLSSLRSKFGDPI